MYCRKKLRNSENKELEKLIPLMYQLFGELRLIHKKFTQKKEPNIQGIDKITQQVTFLFL
jgi:hypothetical protein